MGYPTQTIPPYAEPIHLDEAKSHCRVQVSTDDAQLTAFIIAARHAIEAAIAEQLVVATWQLKLDGLYDCDYTAYDPDGYRMILLPAPPVVSVSSIAYVDDDGATQTMEAADYVIEYARKPCRIRPAYGVTWPTPRDQSAAVTVTYKAGWLTPFTANATTNVCTALGRTFADGDLVRLSNSGGALPAGLAVVTDYYVRDASGSTFKLALTAGGAAIDITDAGTGTSFVGVLPGTIRSAMLLLIGHLYANRESTIQGALAELPHGVEWLLTLSGHGEYP